MHAPCVRRTPAPRTAVVHQSCMQDGTALAFPLVRERTMTTSATIANRIVEAILAQRLAPGTRLGEQPLAMLFDCSRTLVREALTRLAARGIVTVSARRGWYVIEPSLDEAREAFEA